MRNPKPLYLALFLILLLWLLNYIAGIFYFYWTLWWFDFVMHFLAGLGGGLVIVWLISEKNFQTKKVFLITLVSLMLVGIAWEIFEYVFGIAQSTENYILDTCIDLLMDAFGASASVYLFAKKCNRDSSI